jgi:hypothetical protein
LRRKHYDVRSARPQDPDRNGTNREESGDRRVKNGGMTLQAINSATGAKRVPTVITQFPHPALATL